MRIPSKNDRGKDSRHPKFPLSIHKGAGQWMKKIRGRQYYFGPVADPDAALKRYLAEKDDLEAGRKPRPKPDETDFITVLELVNRFLTFKKAAVDTGELKARTFGDYYAVCQMVLSVIDRHRRADDLDVDDYQELRNHFAKGVSLVTLSNRIRHARMIFKFGHDQFLIDHPPRYGKSFNLPRKDLLRGAKQDAGPKMFEAQEIRSLLEAADPVLRAMIYLGINCGYGNHDVGQLPKSVVDLYSGWITWPRPKTRVERRAPLWPETIESLQVAIPLRPNPKTQDDDKYFFLTRTGKSWHKDSEQFISGPITQAFRKLLGRTNLHRPGNGFYSLRRTFETIGGENGDQVAVDRIMGHADNSMAATYRQKVSDERLLRVSNFVRAWVLPASNDSHARKGER